MARNETAVTAALEALLVAAVANIREAAISEAWGGGYMLEVKAEAEANGIKKALMAVYMAQGMAVEDAQRTVEAVAKGEIKQNGYTV